MSDERLYEVLVARTGISGDARLADACARARTSTCSRHRSPAGSEMALVSLNAVRKSFGSRTVLDGPRLRDRATRPRRRDRRERLRQVDDAAADRRARGARRGTSVRRRGIVVSFLPQHPLGDERNALETVQRSTA